MIDQRVRDHPEGTASLNAGEVHRLVDKLLKDPDPASKRSEPRH